MRYVPTAQFLVDAHVSSFLFGAWSTIECLVYAANALGYAVAPDDFLSVDDAKQLRRISPLDLYGRDRRPGYERHLANFTHAMVSHERVLNRLSDLHSVSKHRRAVAAGGTMDTRLQSALEPLLGEMAIAYALERATWADILLDSAPKQPLVELDPTREPVRLATVESDYREVLHACAVGLHADVVGATA